MKKNFLSLLLTAIMCVPFTASAQTTIGSGNAPSQWSLLDLDNSARIANDEQPLALHLPRLTLAQRDALVLPTTENEPFRPLERGLMIFRIDCVNPNIGCLEVWNGEEWMSFCEGDPTDD